MTNPRPTREANTEFYSKLYNKFHKREARLGPDDPYVVKSRKLAPARVDRLARFLDPNHDASVFEIGAGVGQFQVVAREHSKWTLSGLEPGQEQAALCKTFGLNVENAFFEEIALDDEAFDAVVSFHVFEHVASPAQFLRFANRVLRTGGLLHLEVPNLSRPGTSFEDFLQFPHLHSFSGITLRNYLEHVGGFKVIYTADRCRNLTMIARKTGPALDGLPQANDFEYYDVADYMKRLQLLTRVHRLARCFPPVWLFDKIRSTLLTV